MLFATSTLSKKIAKLRSIFSFVTQQAQLNINYASVAEAAKIRNSSLPKITLALVCQLLIPACAMATLEVVETSSPERQSGIICRYTIVPNIISKPTLHQSKS